MLVIKERGGAIFFLRCRVVVRGILFFVADSSDFFFFFLEERFTAPSVLHAVDRLGREAVVTTGSAHSRERLTFKGQAESAGRK